MVPHLSSLSALQDTRRPTISEGDVFFFGLVPSFPVFVYRKSSNACTLRWSNKHKTWGTGFLQSHGLVGRHVLSVLLLDIRPFSVPVEFF